MNSRSMAGWIGFAGILMVLLGGLSVFQGLIALTFNIIVLYALIVRWDESERELQTR